jgi:hypothetical protein
MHGLKSLEAFLYQPDNHLNALEAADSQWLESRLRYRWYPRNLQAAAAFVAKLCDGKPFYLYGAGSHSHALLNGLDVDTLACLQGIIDQKASRGQTLKGQQVLSPERLLEDRETAVILSHHEFEDNMADSLSDLGVASDRIHPIYADAVYGEAVMDQLWPQLQAETARLPTPEGRRVVVVNARQQRRILSPQIISRLRSDGNDQFIQVNLERWSEEEPTVAAFDAAIDTHNSIGIALNAIEWLDPDVIYVQEHYSSGNFLPMVIGLAFPHRRILGEFYDFLALTFNDPYVMHWGHYWRKADVSLALAAERWCIQHLDGLVTKESGAVLDDYLDGCSYLELQPHQSRTQFRTRQGGRQDPPRLVWAGIVTSSRFSPILYGDNQLIDIFQGLVDAGLPTTAYSTCPSNASLAAELPEYLELAARGHFNIYPVLPFETLLDTLCNHFDFGLLLGMPKPESQQGISYRVTVSGKMFTYLSAGIPLIIGDYLEVMANWVRRHELGLVVNPHRLEELPAMIAACDYSRLLRKVQDYRESHDLEAQLPRLQRFLFTGASDESAPRM